MIHDRGRRSRRQKRKKTKVSALSKRALHTSGWVPRVGRGTLPNPGVTASATRRQFGSAGYPTPRRKRRALAGPEERSRSRLTMARNSPHQVGTRLQVDQFLLNSLSLFLSLSASLCPSVVQNPITASLVDGSLLLGARCRVLSAGCRCFLVEPQPSRIALSRSSSVSSLAGVESGGA
ncbi:hypothetical protein LZ30DRAFT_16003 [Colletotrichum cereale]|nr:hypothetical protein LZ30DRAFT_16003 [Colletotrichum cereale]